MELTIWHTIILKVMDRSGIALTTNLIAAKTHSNHRTIKKKLWELEKEGMVERTGKKWKIREEMKNDI